MGYNIVLARSARNTVGTTADHCLLSGMPKLRLLCIHGYGQAGAAFRAKTGAVRSEVKKLAEFTFVDAPHIVTPEESEARRRQTGREAIGSETDPCQETPRSWWRFSEDSTQYDPVTFDDSISALHETFKHQGPFDGLLGFSQG